MQTLSLDSIAAATAYDFAVKHANKGGYKIPAALTRDMQQLEQLDRASLPEIDRDELATALATAVLENRDPLADETVKRATLRASLKDLGYGTLLAGYAEKQRVEVLRKYLPALIKTWAKVVAEADQIIEQARHLIPGLNLTDGNQIHRLEPAQMSTWGEAKAAAQRAANITETWSMCALATNTARIQPGTHALILADLTAPDLDNLGHQPKTEDVIRAGHSLALATIDDYKQRITRIEAQRQAAQPPSPEPRAGVNHGIAHQLAQN